MRKQNMPVKLQIRVQPPHIVKAFYICPSLISEITWLPLSPALTTPRLAISDETQLLQGRACHRTVPSSPSATGAREWQVGKPGPDSTVPWSVHPIRQGCGFDLCSRGVEESTNKCINTWNNTPMFLSL